MFLSRARCLYNITGRRSGFEISGFAESLINDAAIGGGTPDCTIRAQPPARYTDCVRLRPPDPEYLNLLKPYGEVIQQLALAARKLILEEAPEASEFVYEVYTIANHFTFTDRPGDAFVFTTTHANWVNLGFNFGSMLPDPDGLLRGEGKWIRHIRITQSSELDAPGVRELVRAAIANAERPEGKAGRPHAVIRKAQTSRKRSSPRPRPI